MNIICIINKDTLYEQCLKEGVPFFKWHSWIESVINKEVLSKIIKAKKSGTGGVKRPVSFIDKPAAKSTGLSTKEKLLKLQNSLKK
jgi:hypothetical protein